jgi:hypothetical protein
MNTLKIDPMAKEESLWADILWVGMVLEDIDSDFYHKIIEVEPL